ncbi:MAG: hypothetical protein NVSMB65_08930 [Chloroflexota bacterium]
MPVPAALTPRESYVPRMEATYFGHGGYNASAGGRLTLHALHGLGRGRGRPHLPGPRQHVLAPAERSGGNVAGRERVLGSETAAG